MKCSEDEALVGLSVPVYLSIGRGLYKFKDKEQQSTFGKVSIDEVPEDIGHDKDRVLLRIPLHPNTLNETVEDGQFRKSQLGPGKVAAAWSNRPSISSIFGRPTNDRDHQPPEERNQGEFPDSIASDTYSEEPSSGDSSTSNLEVVGHAGIMSPSPSSTSKTPLRRSSIGIERASINNRHLRDSILDPQNAAMRGFSGANGQLLERPSKTFDGGPQMEQNGEKITGDAWQSKSKSNCEEEHLLTCGIPGDQKQVGPSSDRLASKGPAGPQNPAKAADLAQCLRSSFLAAYFSTLFALHCGMFSYFWSNGKISRLLVDPVDLLRGLDREGILWPLWRQSAGIMAAIYVAVALPAYQLLYNHVLAKLPVAE